MLLAFAIGLEGIDGGIGGGGGGRHELGVGFLPFLAVGASGMAGIAVGGGIDASTNPPFAIASFFTMDLSNLSARCHCRGKHSSVAVVMFLLLLCVVLRVVDPPMHLGVPRLR